MRACRKCWMPSDGARRLSRSLCARSTMHLLTAVPGTDRPFVAAQRFRPIAEVLLPCQRGGPDAET
jgi:hypothetical protein